MSIAVSSVVKPSRLLRAAVGGMCFGMLLVGCALGLEQVGKSFHLYRAGVACVCIVLALTGLYLAAGSTKIHRIDISGTGQIRLTEYQPSDDVSPMIDRMQVPNSGTLVRLMADSTLWPNLLLLRLQAEDRRISVLPILPDSVTASDFRALSVACRWIALREQGDEVKIL